MGILGREAYSLATNLGTRNRDGGSEEGGERDKELHFVCRVGCGARL